MAESKTNTKGEFVAALIKFRAALNQPKKDTVNPFFKSKYATLDSVVAAIDEACAVSGLSYVQMTQFKDGDFVLITTILHTSGECMQGTYVLPATGKPQEIGAALTYARRYALSAAFGIVADDDDDGNSAAVVEKKIKPVEFKNFAGDAEMFERDKQWILDCADVASLKTYYDGVKARKDKFSAEQYAELVTITTNKNKALKGEL